MSIHSTKVCLLALGLTRHPVLFLICALYFIQLLLPAPIIYLYISYSNGESECESGKVLLISHGSEEQATGGAQPANVPRAEKIREELVVRDRNETSRSRFPKRFWGLLFVAPSRERPTGSDAVGIHLRTDRHARLSVNENATTQT